MADVGSLSTFPFPLLCSRPRKITCKWQFLSLSGSSAGALTGGRDFLGRRVPVDFGASPGRESRTLTVAWLCQSRPAVFVRKPFDHRTDPRVCARRAALPPVQAERPRLSYHGAAKPVGMCEWRRPCAAGFRTGNQG